MPKIKTFFTGGEGLNWALDEDLKLLKKSSYNYFKCTSIKDSQIIFSVWPSGLSNISKNLLKKKIVVCQFDNPPFHWSKQKVFSEIISYVDLWIAHSKQSLIQAKKLNLKVANIFYRNRKPKQFLKKKDF